MNFVMGFNIICLYLWHLLLIVFIFLVAWPYRYVAFLARWHRVSLPQLRSQASGKTRMGDHVGFLFWLNVLRHLGRSLRPKVLSSCPRRRYQP